MADVTFGCCFCGEEVQEGDEESCQLVVLRNWFKDREEWEEQYFFCHRKPCLEAAMSPGFRVFDDEFDWEEEDMSDAAEEAGDG